MFALVEQNAHDPLVGLTVGDVWRDNEGFIGIFTEDLQEQQQQQHRPPCYWQTLAMVRDERLLLDLTPVLRSRKF